MVVRSAEAKKKTTHRHRMVIDDFNLPLPTLQPSKALQMTGQRSLDERSKRERQYVFVCVRESEKERQATRPAVWRQAFHLFNRRDCRTSNSFAHQHMHTPRASWYIGGNTTSILRNPPDLACVPMFLRNGFGSIQNREIFPVPVPRK